MKIKEFVNNLPNKKVYVGIGVFIFLLLIAIVINKTHAYYNSTPDAIPLVNAKVGDFAKNLQKICSNYNNLGECVQKCNLDEIANLESASNMNGRNDTLRRYQGDATTVNNNYICFGTTNKEECTNDTEKYMYRIIGIVTKEGDNETEKIGQLKVIKKEALSETLQWNSTWGNVWGASTLYYNLNVTDFLKNISTYPYMDDENWTRQIVIHNWKYGNISSSNDYASGRAVLAREKTWVSGREAHIGLMYLSDYYLAYDNTTNWYNNSDTNNWLHLSNNDTTDFSYEWTMTDVENKETVWAVSTLGNVALPDRRDTYASVRPVFYIENTMKIKSGNGTKEDPYIFEVPGGQNLVSVCEGYSNIGDCVQKANLDEISGLETIASMQEREDTLRRFQGTDEIVTNNYICLGTSNVTTCTEDPDSYMYRIIGIVTQNDEITKEQIGQLKVIKQTVLSRSYWNSSYKEKTLTSWAFSNLRSKINGSTFLTNSKYHLNEELEVGGKYWSGQSDETKNVIANHTWLNADLPSGDEGYAYTATGAEAFKSMTSLWRLAENTSQQTNSTVGLLYPFDISLSWSNTARCHQNYQGVTREVKMCEQSWLLFESYTGGSCTKVEHTMTRSISTASWSQGCGSAGSNGTQSMSYVRPVMYIRSGVKLDSKSLGTAKYPYIITDVE